METKKVSQWGRKNCVVVKWAKRVVSTLLTAVLCVGMLPANLEASGQTVSEQNDEVLSDTVTYELVDGVLTFSGQGEVGNQFIADEGGNKKYPWDELRDTVTKIVLEEGITGIVAWTFNDFPNLESVSLPESLKSVGDNAFSNCPKLTDVKIPDNVTYIGAVAFEYDTSLTEIYIGGNKGASGYVVGNSIFRGCTALKNIHVSEDNIGLSEKDGVLFSKNGEILMQYPGGRTESVYKIPEGTKEIGAMAFARAVNLENIEIPEGVTKIVKYAMYDCPKLKEVVIPSSVISIEEGMGACCFNLKFIDNKSAAVCLLNSTSGGIVWTNEAGEMISQIDNGIAYQHRVVEKIQMDSELSINVGESITLSINFSAPNYLNSQGILASYSDLVISSSNPEIVQVTEEGVVTAVAVGSAVIEVKNRYSQEWYKPVAASCVVTVNKEDDGEITPAEPTAKPTNVPETYKITYILNKGTNNNLNPSMYTTKDVKLAAPTRAGYSFAGWYTDETTKNKITVIKANWKKNITLYAKWTKVKVGKPTIKSVKNQKGKKIKVQLKKKVSGAKGYEVTYSTNKKFKKSVKKVCFKGSNKTIGKLKKNKTYYVKVRAYKMDSAGQKVYGSYSSVKKIKIKK